MKLFALLFFLTLLAVTDAFCQGVKTSRGKDFWITFLPNYHNYKHNPTPMFRYGDSLYLFISCDEPVDGTITYRDSSGNVFSEGFSISDPDEIYTFKRSSFFFELVGINDSEQDPTGFDQNQCEKIAKQFFHIEAEKDVAVVAHSQAYTSSDGFLAFPTTSLGTRYRIVSYPSSYNTPSEFTILATEDDTRVEINPSCPTAMNGPGKQTIVLNKGESYMVQARFRPNGSDIRSYDLTGTLVTTGKPVAVFGGQQRAAIPYDIADNNPSRDLLVEQMIPYTCWGRNCFLIPLAVPFGVTSQINDVYRIISTHDSTKVYRDGNLYQVLNAGEFFEERVDGAHYFEGSKPVRIAHYKETSGNGNNFQLGDPFMMLIPPKEQFLSEYRFNSIQSYEYGWDPQIQENTWVPVYEEHFIAVISKPDKIETITLDGNPLIPSSFKPIGNSGYSYANIRIPEAGTHFIKGDDFFGIYAYGYGQANSYGYVGGMGLNVIDYTPPAIAATQQCYELQGMISDTSQDDSGIEAAEVIAGSEVNVSVTIPGIQKYQDTAPFSASLVSRYADGTFGVAARDSVGITQENFYQIPGFTIGIAGVSDNPSETAMAFSEQLIAIPGQYCWNYEVTNYGLFTHTFDLRLLLGTKGYTITTPSKLTLESGESANVRVCFDAAETGIFSDTLIAFDGCTERRMSSISAFAANDTDGPAVLKTIDDCKNALSFVFADPDNLSSGMKDVKADTLSNCILTELAKTTKLIKGRVLVLDPYQDAYFKIRAMDNAGNEIIYEDHIPGYTINFAGAGDEPFTSRMGDIPIGSTACDSLVLTNYGKFPITLDRSKLSVNDHFSIPLSQFPFTLQPQESKPLIVCFLVSEADRDWEDIFQTDTLALTFNCIDRIAGLEGRATPLRIPGTAKCDFPVTMVVNSVPEEYYLGDGFPNPGSDEITVEFGVPAESEVRLDLVDTEGNVLSTNDYGTLAKGNYTITLSAEKLKNGIYFYRFSAAGFADTKKLVIIK